MLNKPQLTETREDDKPSGMDQPPKPNEDFPDCTTYFYHRWMWIQVTQPKRQFPEIEMYILSRKKVHSVFSLALSQS